ncbi:hypothetical protein NDU88_004618 [Pleurodeles waltl]|uniref:Uncharacterized protein n=1 Tax=Pleurodeles waltl TaxID=8319 RepID=A0AAV7SJA9_PLEWA|nr:hypothetical protein NDU88_004618 [Pleurodeles waltl]
MMPLQEPPITLSEAKLEKIIAAIADTRQDLQNRVDVVVMEVGLSHDDQRKLAARITQAERKLDMIQPIVSILEELLQFLTAKVHELENRVEDSERQYGCNNLRVVGFPMGMRAPT